TESVVDFHHQVVAHAGRTSKRRQAAACRRLLPLGSGIGVQRSCSSYKSAFCKVNGKPHYLFLD
ncbi:MAG: hypothetical protein IIY94_03555, partial [Oscillospiraceae bacterium]|nr:hypothetical protein [Oscillospiraceae bacterium]